METKMHTTNMMGHAADTLYGRIPANLVRAAFLSAIALGLAGFGISGAQAGNVKKLQLGLKVEKGAACPRTATMMAWAHTTGPGPVQIVIRNASGNTSIYSVPAVKGAAGNWLATYKSEFNITTDVNTRYRAEAAGKRSNWVNLVATCGPQVRTTTKTTSSKGKPPVKHAGQDKGPQVRTETKTVGSTGKPPVKKATVPTTKPATKSAGKQTKKSAVKPIKQCQLNKVSITRHAALTKKGGLATAKIAWIKAVEKKYGSAWMNPNRAKNWEQECVLAGTFTCMISAIPCAK